MNKIIKILSMSLLISNFVMAVESAQRVVLTLAVLGASSRVWEENRDFRYKVLANIDAENKLSTFKKKPKHVSNHSVRRRANNSSVRSGNGGCNRKDTDPSQRKPKEPRRPRQRKKSKKR